jgi:hypothetical protein
LIWRRINIENVPLRSLLLHELFDFFSKGSRIFIRIVLDSLKMENVRLVLLGIFVDLASSKFAKSLITVDLF